MRRWTRRVLSWTLLLLVLMILVATSWIWIPLALLIDAVRGTTYCRAMLFVTNYAVFQCVGLAMLLWAWLKYTLPLGPDDLKTRAAMHQVQRDWADRVAKSTTSILQLKFNVECDYDFGERKVILASRHVSIGDTFLPMILVSIPYSLSLGYVMKKELEWDPSIDVAVSRMDHLFITRSSEDSAREVALIGKVIRSPEVDGAVIFPEGTRFTPKKREQIIDSLEEKGNHDLAEWARQHKNVLPPRPGGLLSILANNDGADVLFCSHRGFENARTFGDILSGSFAGTTIDIKIWSVAYEDIPETEEARRTWIMEQWSKVDAFIVEKSAPPQ